MCHRDPRRDRRRPHECAVGGDRSPHRGGATVSGADQGCAYSGDEGGGRCEINSSRERVARETAALKARGVTPGLTVVLVGDNPASAVYVAAKEKQGREVGMK